MSRAHTIEERFLSGLTEVEGPLETPCWHWTKSLHTKGYGQIWFEGKIWLTHRISWLLCVGDIPDGLFVLHRCDNPRCCNPEHLFTGTDQDNKDDMIAKGRYINGRTLRKSKP